MWGVFSFFNYHFVFFAMCHCAIFFTIFLCVVVATSSYRLFEKSHLKLQYGHKSSIRNAIKMTISDPPEFKSNPDKTPIPSKQSQIRNISSKVSFSQGLTNLLSGKGWKGDLILSKDSLAKFGVNCLLSYGFVSNFSYITCVIIAWVAHGKKFHLSPLAAGQWKQFLLIYSGLWVANNIIRPARFSLSLLLSPFFDRGIIRLQSSLRLSRGKATALMVFLVNFCGTISYLVLGLLTATRLANVPLLP